MINYLIRHPISVIMIFLACLIVGGVIYTTLPTSLLPDINIPRMTIEVEGENMTASEMESTRMQPIRRAVMQVGGLEELRSETRSGKGIITLTFEFGTNTNLAFIDVNEKIESALNSLPKDASRPKVVKASATDIPVFYLNMSLREGHTSFLELCEIAENTVRRRLEQMPQIAMVDVTGLAKPMIKVVPDTYKMEANGISYAMIEDAIVQSNTEPGSMLVRDGYYEYNIRVESQLATVDDVRDIYIRQGQRLLQLKEICDISTDARQESGRSFVDGRRAVTMAIIKQSEEHSDDLKQNIDSTIRYFKDKYPDIDFKINRNQTELLDSTISNLQQNFVLGFILIIITTILFIGRIRLSLVISVTMLSSVVITFLLFGAFRVSLNIISLYGLILAVGMMIDNAIIVTENITQHQEMGKNRYRAIIDGTSEMITPLLSSSLTTIAVFVPLVFISGIAGSLFFDQAFSITSGLTVSYLTGIMLLPVLYCVTKSTVPKEETKLKSIANRISLYCQNLYEKGATITFKHKRIVCISVFLSLPLCAYLFMILDKERLPQISQQEMEMIIDWNEDISLDENQKRTLSLFQQVEPMITEQSAFIGLQDFTIDQNRNMSISESSCYIKAVSPLELKAIQDTIEQLFKTNYPKALVSFAPPMTIIEKIFDTRQPELEIQLSPKRHSDKLSVEAVENIRRKIESMETIAVSRQAVSRQYVLQKHYDKMALYQISAASVDSALRRQMQCHTITSLQNSQENVPVVIPQSDKNLQQILDGTLLHTGNGTVPLSCFVSAVESEERTEIVAGRDGSYVPLSIHTERITDCINHVRDLVDADKRMNVAFTGSWFSSNKMVRELLLVMLVSLLLMYFILCAQFENFLLPLIVLLEIPIDTAFALTGLWLTGQTLNLMSVIGIIVSCGVVINDSILKISSMNTLRKHGIPLLEAIHTAGRRRVRAILMTSITSIFAMLPILIAGDIGSELQRPLVISMSVALTFGTLVSLFIIPLLYWIVYHHESDK